MKILVTFTKEVTSKKDGKKWIIVNGLKETGEKFDTVMPPEKLPQGFNDYSLVPAEVVELMAQYKTVNIEYNERGQVQSITL